MTEYDNNFSGILSRNDKRTTDSHPEFKGQCTIDGVDHWISGWVKERKDGTGKFFSLKFKVKEGQKAPAKPVRDDFEDEKLPF